MKRILSIILTALIFGTGGTAGGYFFAKKKYLALADKEVASMRKQLVEANKGRKFDKPKDPIPEKPSENKLPNIPTINKPKPTDFSRQEVVDYTKKAKQYKPDVKENDPNFHRISTEEFQSSDFNSQTLHYYPEEGYITDQDNNIVNNVYEVLGKDSTLWDDPLQNEEVVYIRNEKAELDYEILRATGNWNDVATPQQKQSLSGKNSSD